MMKQSLFLLMGSEWKIPKLFSHRLRSILWTLFLLKVVRRSLFLETRIGHIG